MLGERIRISSGDLAKLRHVTLILSITVQRRELSLYQ